MSKVCVLGSINLDIVYKVRNMPLIGQTIMGESLEYIPGGKGANQAVAVRRMGAEVSFIGKVGKDDNGKSLVEKLKSEGINTDYIFNDDKSSTGTAIIAVNGHGNNSIVVIPGSNMTINHSQLEQAKAAIKASDILVAQFETPVDITIKAFKFARENGIITILNPAPAKEISEELLEYTDIIIPNETETEQLSRIPAISQENIKEAGRFFVDKGIKYAIITLGEKGAAIVSEENFEIVPAYKVKAVDTTAAGDCFIGALVSKLQGNKLSFNSIKEAVAFGNKASSITVQRPGAQPSIPRLEELI